MIRILLLIAALSLTGCATMGGADEEAELPAKVRTGISRAEVERVGAFDDALLGDRFPATEAQTDQVHGWLLYTESEAAGLRAA